MHRYPAVVAVILLLYPQALAGEDAAVERYIEFRDGTIIRLPVVDEEWKVSVVRPGGQVEQKTIKLSSLKSLTLCSDPVFDKKKRILKLVEGMGADDFRERERANEELVRMGAEIRPDLEHALTLFTDPEILHRLRIILGKWPAGPKDATGVYDVLQGSEILRGDITGNELPIRVGGATVRLSRKVVLGMTEKIPESAGLPNQSKPGAASFERLEEKDFPAGWVEEPFETTPDGRKLIIGENIEKLFIPKGFVLSTSIQTSFVSVNNFVVNGKSKGLSAATHQPLFHGEITIRFCKPGREDIKAGVTQFGCWIAHVMPKGTAMAAFDFQGGEIGRIETRGLGAGHEFWGVRSSRPIHRIRIIPNLQIDPDYTLDDFIFPTPQPMDFVHPDKFAVQFHKGERIICTDVSFTKESVRLHGLAGGLPDISRPIADMIRTATPGKERDKRPPPSGLFVELKDGSVLFAPKDNAPKFGYRPGVLKDPDDMVGLWCTSSSGQDWSKAGGTALWDNRKLDWVPIKDVKFLENKVSWATVGKKHESSYFELPPLALGRAAIAPAPGSWRIRTVKGDDLVLSAKDVAKLDGKLSRGLTSTWNGKELSIPLDDILSIYQMSK